MTGWAGSLAAQPSFITVNTALNAPLYGTHVFISPIPDGSAKKIYNITDVKGQVKNTASARSQIRITHLGYLPLVDTIEAGISYTFLLEEDLVNLKEYVITSHAVPTRIEESVYKIKVIDRQRIESQGAMNLRDLLTNDLNVRITQDAQLGAGIKMQGIGGENVKIMIDGVPVIGRLDGNVDLSQITLQNIEKVEIIEGPSSVTYGSNALGGVINLITKKTQHHKFEGNLQAYYETVGNYNVDGRVGWNFKNHTIQLAGGRYFFDGFTTNDSISRVQTWKPKEQYFTTFNYTIGIGNFNVGLTSNFFHEIIQSKGAPEAPFGISATDSYFRTIRNSHSLFLNGYAGKKKFHHIDIVLSHSYFNRRSQSFRKDLVTLDQNLFNESTDIFHQVMSRGIYNYVKPTSRFKIQAGYDINIETAEGPRIENNFQWIGDFAMFSSLEISLFKKLIIKPGFRFGYNTRYTMPVTPSIHLKYSPVKGFDIRMSYARGFRAPSLKELYFLFVDVNHNIYGNKDLGAENSNNATVQLSYSGQKKKFKYGISVNGFYNDIRDQITLVTSSVTPDSAVYFYDNLNRFQSAGAQVNLDLGYDNFTIGLGATYTGIKNSTSEAMVNGGRFVFYPELLANASYFFKWWNGRLNVFFKHTGAQPFLYAEFDAEQQAEVIREGRIAGFGTLDVSYTQQLFKNRLQIGIFGKNLLDVTNIQQTSGVTTGGAHSVSSSSLPTMWGRSFGISLKYNFIVN